MNTCLNHFRDYRLQLLLALLLFSLAAPLSAQAVKEQDIVDQRVIVSTDTSLTEESRTRLLGQLDDAATQLEAAQSFLSRSADFKAVMKRSEEKAGEFELRLQQAQASSGDKSGEVDPAAGAEQIEGQLTLVLAEHQALAERRSLLLKEIDEMPSRRTEIRARLVELQSQGEPTALEGAGETAEQRVAQILANARQQSSLAERESLETEILSETARSRVNGAERAWLGYAIEQSENKLTLLNAALERARSSATEEQLQTTAQLQEKLNSEDPRLQEFAIGNRSLAEQLQAVATQSDAARQDGLAIQSLLQDIEQDAVLMQRRLEVAGRKEVLGRVMITRMDSLPDTNEIRRNISQRDELIASTSLAQIDIEEEFRAINNRQDYLDELAPDRADWKGDARKLVSSLVDQRSELLENNLKSQANLLQILLDNNDRAADLVVATANFHKFLLGNLLWVRNFSFVDLRTMTEQLAVLFAPSSWLQLPQQLVSGYRSQIWSAILVLGFFVALLLRWRLRPVYERLLSRPILLSGATLWHMVGGLALSLLLVTPWPLLLFTLGYCLQAAEPVTAFNDALAPALILTAQILYLLLFIRLIASRMGVGRRFLKWDARMLDSIRLELNWAGPLICLTFLIDVFAFHLDVVASGGPLGALATATIAGAIITMSLRLQRQEIFAEDTLLRFGLRVTAIVGAAVIAMQLLGLLFAAEIYLLALGRSVASLLVIKLVGDVIERWLLILRARLERQAREQQQSLEAEGEDTEEEPSDLVDVISLSEAHSKLLTLARFVASAVVLFVIWAPSLPALNLLDSVTLWQVADSASPDALPRAITLFDLTLSIIILVVTGLVTKHLPSVSEVFMREWFNMSAGARYASSILMQYLVIAIGGSMFLSTIGWEWGKVQWLVAAMGVGIGFGLQEIVANFISGIIILFERPVRVGDIISAGGAEGTVKKINPRATIIETFDRKEHLIPNKELITGQVINWTLSDAAVRVIIPVGIAYGSDVRTALSLLLEAAGEAENVMADPAPRASFEDFGDNSLVLWLRCYVSDDRVGTWTELRTAINDKFNEAGIVISFPQRDVHLDTLEPLQIELKNLGPVTN
jgi:potassium-dependent mechanosensitive channel